SRISVSMRVSLSSSFFFCSPPPPPQLHSFPTRRSSDLADYFLAAWKYRHRARPEAAIDGVATDVGLSPRYLAMVWAALTEPEARSEEHTSELQSLRHLVCRLLLEKKKENSTYARRRRT